MRMIYTVIVVVRGATPGQDYLHTVGFADREEHQEFVTRMRELNYVHVGEENCLTFEMDSADEAIVECARRAGVGIN